MAASDHELVAAVQNQLLGPRAEVRLPAVAPRGLSRRAAAQPEAVPGLAGSPARLGLGRRGGAQAAGGEQGPGGGGAEAVVRGGRAGGVGGEGGGRVVGGGDGGDGVHGVLGVGLTAESSSAL